MRTAIRSAICAAVAAAAVLTPFAATPAQAAPLAQVMVTTQRMSDATLQSTQSGTYARGSSLSLVCYKRGQAVKGYYSSSFPGGWDNLWYQVSDGYYVADVDINTGSNDPVTGTCGTAPPSNCRAYTVIGVRGTDDGSQSSMGNTLPTAVSQFVARKGSANVTSDYVSYPAKGLAWDGYYTDSMAKGRAALIAKLSAYGGSCASTRFVLFGYSQGAHVVGDVVVGLSSTWRARIHAVGLLGDPMFNPGLSGSLTKDTGHGGMFGKRGSWPSGLPVKDICNRGDQVCASITTAQSLGYLTGWFGTPREHAGYTGTTYSPVSGHSAAWAIGDWAGGL